MLCWYEPVVEFEEFLRNSLEEDKKRRQRFEEDGLSAENLIGRFNAVGGVSDEGGVVAEGAVEAYESVHAFVMEQVIGEPVLEEVINSGGVSDEGGVVAEGAVEADESVHAFVMDQVVGEPVLEEVGIETPNADEIPCVHTISCILKKGRDITDYVSPYYTTESMVRLYDNVLYPINGMEELAKILGGRVRA